MNTPALRARWAALAVALALAAPACAPLDAGVSGARMDLRVAERLYFGRSIPGGSAVSDAEWASFVEQAVTPRFPDGLTLIRGEGQWRDATSGALVREPTMVLELIHAGDAASDAKVSAIAEEYKRRFRQDAVLRVRGTVRVAF